MKKLIEKLKPKIKEWWNDLVGSSDSPSTPTEPSDPSNPSNPSQDDMDLSGVIWHGPDIRGWSITSDLPGVSIGKDVVFRHSKAGQWRPTTSDGLEANCWLVAMVDGQWHAASFEWLRSGQTSKPIKTLAGDHCKVAPLSGSWRPKSGDTLYIGVAGLSRGGKSNVKERTPFRRATYP